MKKKKFKIISVLCSTLAIATATFNPGAFAMPNPLTEHKTYEEAATWVGFKPLYLPSIAEYELYYIGTINHDLADLSFRHLKNGSRLRLRTAKINSDYHPAPESISGVYGVEWERQVPSHNLTVFVGKIGENEYNAYWEIGDYRFSALATAINYAEFLNLIDKGLVDLSVHYYGGSQNDSDSTRR